MTAQTERLVGYPVAGIDIGVLSRLVDPVPLLVVHDRRDRETSHDDSVRLVENWAGPARLISTDGLGHRRLLIDRNVIDETVRFLRAGQAAVEASLLTVPANGQCSSSTSPRAFSSSCSCCSCSTPSCTFVSSR